MKLNTSNIGWPVVMLVILICIIAPLLASSGMGAEFVASQGQGAMSHIYMLAACAIIFSNPVLGYIAGRLTVIGATATACYCWAVWILIVAFSTITSSASILDGSSATIQREIERSAQGASVQASIDSNLATIRALQASIDGLDPIRRRTERKRLAADIAVLQQQNQSNFRRQDAQVVKGTGSATAQAYKKLEAVGITRVKIAFLFSLLLDLIPFGASLGLGRLVGKAQQNSQRPPQRSSAPVGMSGKKPGGHLRSVAG